MGDLPGRPRRGEPRRRPSRARERRPDQGSRVRVSAPPPVCRRRRAAISTCCKPPGACRSRSRGTEGIDHVEIVATAGADPIRRSATTLVQGELNSREGALWGIATNGLTWRILRDNESITRPGYIEIDLARIFRDDLYSDFSAFWLIAHRSRFPQEDAAGSDCVLERWRQLGREQGVTARDDLRDGVQKALFHFGRGFLENPANKALVDRLNADGERAADEGRLLPPACCGWSTG